LFSSLKNSLHYATKIVLSAVHSIPWAPADNSFHCFFCKNSMQMPQNGRELYPTIAIWMLVFYLFLIKILKSLLFKRKLLHILDIFFNNPPKIDHIRPRKLQLPPQESFLLYGARGVGKTTLIVDYIQKSVKGEYLYIDCQDPTFILNDMETEDLNFYIEEESINTLILDHFYHGFLDTLPKVQQLIIISRELLQLPLQSFSLYPLDFEEFLNFHSNFSLTNSFDLYTKLGSLPQVAISQSATISAREHFFERFDAQEGKVLLILSLFHGRVTTTHQIYQRASEYFKISKDWLYRAIKEFLAEGVIYQIETHEKGFGKKIFLYDFLFSKYLNKNQTFLTSFDSIVTLALIKHQISVKSIANPLGYICEDGELIIVAPFESEEHLWVKVQTNFALYTKLAPSRVTILTVNSSFSFTIKDITFQALPFYEWVVGLN
jgi:predicted AAA+ superfamily ATPase